MFENFTWYGCSSMFEELPPIMPRFMLSLLGIKDVLPNKKVITPY